MGAAFEHGSRLLNSVWFDAWPLVDTNHENKRPFARSDPGCRGIQRVQEIMTSYHHLLWVCLGVYIQRSMLEMTCNSTSFSHGRN